MRVLVTGGRKYRNVARITEKLLELQPTVVIHGDCGEVDIEGNVICGADKLAGVAAKLLGIPEEKYPAKWDVYGPSAGPIRNQVMISQAKPDVVVAFPGGRGTADCVRRAKAAGLRVVVLD